MIDQFPTFHRNRQFRVRLGSISDALGNNNNNKRQFVRCRNMSVDITRAPYRQCGNVVRDSSTAQLQNGNTPFYCQRCRSIESHANTGIACWYCYSRNVHLSCSKIVVSL